MTAFADTDLLLEAVREVLAYDPADEGEVESLVGTFCPTGPGGGVDNSCGKGDGGGSGGGSGGSPPDKGGDKGGDKGPEDKPPKLTAKDLSKAATAQLQKSADADKAGDKKAAQTHRAAAYMYNRAAMHLDNFRESKDPKDKAKADAVRKVGHEFATGQRMLSTPVAAGAVIDGAATTNDVGTAGAGTQGG